MPFLAYCAFSNLFNAQSILDKQSLSTPDSGKQIASLPPLCLRRYKDNVTSTTFDGEGTQHAGVELINNGVLTGFLHSCGTAKAQCPTYRSRKHGSQSDGWLTLYHVFQVLQPKRECSLADAKNVIFIDQPALHAGVKATQVLSLPFDGWVVEDGN